MLDCNELKKYTVKVSYDMQGSGVIFLPLQESKYCYTLTAKHNFKDMNRKIIPIEELKLSDIKIEYKKFKSHNFQTIMCEDVIYTDYDLAILITQTSVVEKIIDNIEVLNILNIDRFDDCTFKGYPAISPKKSRCLHSHYLEQSDENIFTIDVSKTLSTFESSEVENTSGFSGSGVLTPFSNEPYLVGLILNVENAFNELTCLDFRKININDILEKHNYPRIEIIDKETFVNLENKVCKVIKSINPKLSSEEFNSSKNKIYELLEKRVARTEYNKLNMVYYSNSTDKLNNDMLNYLENSELQKAKDLSQVLSPNGETYRLKALISLFEKDIDSAKKYIKKAKDKMVVVRDIEFTEGLIYYFSAILKDGFDNLTPYLIDRVFVKNDKDSLESIQKAQSTFLNLSSKYQSVDYDTWYLASLHLTSLTETKKMAKEFIEKIPNHYGAIIYITTYKFDIDLSKSIEYFENIEYKSFKDIISLFNCYIHKSLYEQALALLDTSKDEFKDISLFERNYINIYMLQYNFEEALNIINQSENKNIKTLKDSILIEQYYYNKEWDKLIKLYEKENRPLGLFKICRVKAIQNDWKFIASCADELIESIQTEAVFDLILTATYNNREYKKTLEIFKKYNIVLTDKLKRIKSNSLDKLGETVKAISITEDIVEKDSYDMSNLIYQYNKIGSNHKLESLARKILQTESIPDDTKIFIAHSLKNSNQSLAKEVISDIDIDSIQDENVLNILPLALELNIEEFQKVLFPKLDKLIDKDSSYGMKLNVDNLVKFIDENSKRVNQILENYKRNSYSFHFLDDSGIFLDKLLNKTDKQLFIRAGNRVEVKLLKNTDSLYLDISSLFLIYDLKILDLVISNYEIYIPAYTIQMLNSSHTYRYENYSKELVQTLNLYIEKNKIKFSQALEKDEFDKSDINNLEFLNLLSITKNKIKENSIILVDDRFLNSFFQIDTTFVFGISDLLKTLLENKKITKEEYFQKILLLREKKLLYIPFEEDEILFHLSSANIEDSKLIESSELKILRQYFAYTIKNLKYLTFRKNQKSSLEIEYFNHIHFILENIYLKLWEKDKSHWNIYINYLLENFTIINTLYFVKDSVEFYNEKRMIALKLSKIVYHSFFKIDDIKEYLNKIEFMFLEPLLYRDKKLFNEFIDLLKYQLMQDYSKNDEERRVFNKLHIELINRLPHKIKDKILEDKEIIEKFNLIEIIKIDNISIKQKKLISKMNLVLNQNLKEKIAENFEIYLDNNLLLIKNISTDNIQQLSDEFLIMSSSKNIQYKLLEDNYKWFDFKKPKVKEFKKNILSITNPIKRFKKLEYYINLSGEEYYLSLYDELKSSKRIDFKILLPKKIELVAYHYRFEMINDFEKNKNIANKELLKENNIAISLLKLCSLPQELPKSIYIKIDKLSYREKVKLLKRFTKIATTPLSSFHFIKIASRFLDNKLAIRVMKKLISNLSTDILLEIGTYLEVYRWTYYSFKNEFEISNELLFILSWGHTDRLFRNFKVLNIDLSQLKKEFTTRTKFYIDEVFNKKDISDVLDPSEIDEVSFLYKGLHYALGDNIDLIKDSNFNDYIYMQDENKLPNLHLFKDFGLLNNCCNSFMDKDYDKFFVNLIGEDFNIFSKQSLLKLAKNTINDIKKDSTKYELFNILKIIFVNAPMYEECRDDFVKLILDIDFIKIEEIYQITILNFASNQNIYFKNKDLENHIKENIILLCKKSISQDEFIKYFDVLIYLSLGISNNIEERVKYLNNLLKEVTTDNNKEIIKNILSNLIFQFSTKESNLLVEYLVDLREM